MIEPNAVSLEEIETSCTNHSMLRSSIESIFSSFYSKRRDMTEENTEMLKHYRNLVRIKWREVHLSSAPKFHMLQEHAPDTLINLNGFCDVGRMQLSDDIKFAWHVTLEQGTFEVRTKKVEPS